MPNKFKPLVVEWFQAVKWERWEIVHNAAVGAVTDEESDNETISDDECVVENPKELSPEAWKAFMKDILIIIWEILMRIKSCKLQQNHLIQPLQKLWMKFWFIQIKMEQSGF